MNYSRRAFTLLELMIVLALLVVLAAVVYPALDRPFANERLRKGADQIRTEWMRARVRAMTSGVPQVFRYQPESGLYRLETWGSMDVEVEASSAADLNSALAPQPVLHGTNAEGDRNLPDEVFFMMSATVLDTKSLTVAPATVGTVAQQTQWSEPIYFYPDGTTSTAQLRLRNQNDLYIDLMLRGLTGVVTVTDVMTEQELPR